jgi:hypothetical protein
MGAGSSSFSPELGLVVVAMTGYLMSEKCTDSCKEKRWPWRAIRSEYHDLTKYHGSPYFGCKESRVKDENTQILTELERCPGKVLEVQGDLPKLRGKWRYSEIDMMK